MKKFLFSGLLVASAIVGVQAQGIRYGVQGGVNVSTVTGQGRYNGGLSLGHTVGILTDVPLTSNKFFSLQPELIYIRKGFWLTTLSFTAQTRVRLHYLSLPLLAKIRVGGLVLEAGPQVSYLLGLRDYNPTFSLVEQRNPYSYQRWELGYVAGIGYELKNGLGVGVRYNAGITRVRYIPMHIRNSTWQFQLSYLVTHP